jgi:putative spermidine/putrescine transport system ATP-binding protein
MSIADRIAVMNNGVLEQMDSPEEIYARPATLFVATFIGTMNRLEAHLAGDGSLQAGPFSARMEVLGALSEPLVAGVRPEDLQLDSDSRGVPARIDSVVDLGHYRRVTLQATNANLLAFVPKSESVPAERATVTPRRVLVYADGHLLGVSAPTRSFVNA